MKKNHLYFLALFLICASAYAAQNLTDTIEKIETRRGRWTSFHGFLRMNFSTPQGKTADCRAEIYYNRLEEQIALKGFRENRELLFIFRTDDRNFRLYLPKRETEFTGTIFDLEDSPALHSHLKALDLYRALKPGLIRENDAEIEESSAGLTLLKSGVRNLWVNVQGDVLKETFGVKTSIERSDFKKINLEGKNEFYYPFRIAIKNAVEAGLNQTELVFESLEFDSEENSKFPNLKVPEGIKTYDVSGEFKKQEALTLS